MRDWRTQLRDSDPGGQAEMPAADVHRLRATVLAAAANPDHSLAFGWPRPFVFAAATLSLMCGVALAALQQNIREVRRTAAVESAAAASETPDSGSVAQKQQLQFATPGGTRIIWVFDSEFEIKGTLP